MSYNPQDSVVTKVEERGDSYSLAYEGYIATFKKEYFENVQIGDYRVTVVPKVGDTIRVYTKNFSLIRGLSLMHPEEGEIVIFYKSDLDLDREHEEFKDSLRKKQEQEFLRDQAKLDADYANLPDPFKKRIDRFREAGGTDWRIKYEAYEMSCCVDAVKVAARAKKEENPIEWLAEFRKLPYEGQKPEVDFFGGHSGNSFGFAMQLAQLYVLDDDDMIYKMHGALTLLTGCKDYHCTHPWLVSDTDEVS